MHGLVSGQDDRASVGLATRIMVWRVGMGCTGW